MKDYQLIVIGGGAAGMTVAAGAANLGAKVALVEKKKHLGGDCLHVGCVPSKALIAASKEASSMMQAARVLGAEFDGRDHYQTTKARVDRARAIIQDHDGTERFEKLGVDVYIGEASFQSPYELKVGDDLLIGKKFVIATGSQPTIPPIDGLDDVPYLTNEQVFEEETLPESIIVIGAGTIGLELAQSFARLGSQVTVLEAQDTFLPREDESVSKLLRSQLEMAMRLKIGININQVSEVEGAKSMAKRSRTRRTSCSWRQDGNRESMSFDSTGLTSTSKTDSSTSRRRTARHNLISLRLAIRLRRYRSRTQLARKEKRSWPTPCSDFGTRSTTRRCRGLRSRNRKCSTSA